jgi:hypothetical protein
VGVKLARHKNQGDDGDVNKVSHRFESFRQYLDSIAARQLIKKRAAGVKKVLRFAGAMGRIRAAGKHG